VPTWDIYDTLREWKKCRGPDRHSGSVPFTGRTIGFKNIQTKVGNAQSVERGTLRFFAGSL
jgi:hypothetical protein